MDTFTQTYCTFSGITPDHFLVLYMAQLNIFCTGNWQTPYTVYAVQIPIQNRLVMNIQQTVVIHVQHPNTCTINTFIKYKS